MKHLHDHKDTLHEPISFQGMRDTTKVEISLQYHDGLESQILTYANNVHTPDGGTHLTGFKSALTRMLNRYARQNGLLSEKEANLRGEEVRQGLSAVISVNLLGRLQFETATKARLGNRDIQSVVHSITSENLAKYLAENPAVARRILEKVFASRRTRFSADTE